MADENGKDTPKDKPAGKKRSWMPKMPKIKAPKLPSLKGIFNLKSGRRKAAAAVVGTTLLVGGGIGAHHQYLDKTSEDITFTVQAKEVITYRLTTEELTRIHTKEGVEENMDDRDVSERQIYLVHTDRGTFENTPAWLAGKFNTQELQDSFQIGRTYSATVAGKSIDVLNTRRNIISAEEYVPPPEPVEERVTPANNNGDANLDGAIDTRPVDKTTTIETGGTDTDAAGTQNDTRQPVRQNNNGLRPGS